MDHKGAWWHAPLWSPRSGGMMGAGRQEVGECEGTSSHFLLKTDPKNPTPALSERLQLSLQRTVDNSALLTFFFNLLVFRCWPSDSFNRRGLRRSQRRTDTACTLCFRHLWAIFKKRKSKEKKKVTSHRHNVFVYQLHFCGVEGGSTYFNTITCALGGRQPAR